MPLLSTSRSISWSSHTVGMQTSGGSRISLTGTGGGAANLLFRQFAQKLRENENKWAMEGREMRVPGPTP